MGDISKKEVISLIDEEIAKCPNHHVLSVLFVLKAKTESLKTFTKPVSKIDHLSAFALLQYDKELEEFKKQFRQ